MSLCVVQSRQDMYGLGIRLSSYLQWLAAIAFQRRAPKALPTIRVLGLLLSGGITIGLLAQVIHGQLDPGAIHTLVLLATGPHLFLVPVYAWRLVTCCDDFWDPLRIYKEDHLRTFRVLNYLQALAASSLGVWFYTTHLPNLRRDCHQYGFLFGQVRLDDNAALAAFNAMLFLLIDGACICFALSRVHGCWWVKGRSRKRRLGRKRIRAHQRHMRRFHTVSNVCVFALLVVAIELPLNWNQLSSSDRLDSSAQLIPLVVSIGFVVRTAFFAIAEVEDDEHSTTRRRATRAGQQSSAPVGEAGEGISGLPRRLPSVYAGQGVGRVE
ncbi:hypothetical protein HIM_08110 [Hirsutella minnesotensis 3608]|uniref:Uncharacterized protein n=1 Tax=Hirsutella minnesotensis 3608 TaxID=1043627 RepID=A0A0F7ZHD3_9HYPO|nr:hypothetical protein HIM_08110 [Hirsutella minnesotensis 3608]